MADPYGFSKIDPERRNNRKPISAATVKIYNANLKKLHLHFNGDLKSRAFGWYNDTGAVMKYLEETYPNPNTRRNYVSTLYNFGHTISPVKYGIAQEKYLEEMNKLNADYSKFQESGKPLESQAKNYVPPEEVLEMIKQMNLDAKKNPSRDIDQAVLLYKLYSKIPRRNDFGTLILNTNYPEGKEDHKNYTNLESLFINQYKTSATYQEQELKLPKTLSSLFKSYVKKYDIQEGQPLFINTSGGALSANGLTKLLQKYSQRYLKKNIGTTMLAKIFMSKYAGANEEIKEKAKQRGNSAGMMSGVYIKDFKAAGGSS